jgi:hypothetical protein
MICLLLLWSGLTTQEARVTMTNLELSYRPNTRKKEHTTSWPTFKVDHLHVYVLYLTTATNLLGLDYNGDRNDLVSPYDIVYYTIRLIIQLVLDYHLELRVISH